jgi:hypothetical protein
MVSSLDLCVMCCETNALGLPKILSSDVAERSVESDIIYIDAVKFLTISDLKINPDYYRFPEILKIDQPQRWD